MVSLSDCIASLEYRVAKLRREIAPLESGQLRVARKENGSPDWIDETAEEIVRLRHEIVETETVLGALVNGGARDAARWRERRGDRSEVA